MSKRRRAFGLLRWLALLPALLAVTPAAAHAADLRQGPEVTVPAGTTVDDDLYAGAGTVTMDGTMNGSLIAAAGNVHVSGTVERDVMVAGGTVIITGPVRGSVRVAGGTVTISSAVAQDVVATGGTLELSPQATVGRDVVVAGGTATVAGTVARDLTAGVGTLDLRGRVERNVRAEVTNLRLASGAYVGGNLNYASDNQAQIASGATVAGRVTHTPSNVAAQPSPGQRAADIVIGWIRTLIGLFVLGLIVVLLFGPFSRRASDAIGRAPLPSLGLGVAVLIGVPIVALIVFLLGLLVGGWPLSLAALALLVIAAAVGYVLSALFVGRTGFRLIGQPEPHPLLALLVGLVVLTLIGLIPFLGGIVDLVAVVFGLGALVLTLFDSWRGSQLAPPRPAPAPATT